MFRPNPKKLGHIVLWVRDIQESASFYTDIVGLTVSDWIADRMVFLRAGEDHHDLALAQLPDDASAKRPKLGVGLEHFSYQIDNFEQMEQMAAFLQEKGVTIDRGPGKHGPGENCFLVFKDPDGNNVEFYCDMQQIPEGQAHEPKVWKDGIDSFDVWHFEKFAVAPPARFQTEDAKTED